MSLDEIKKRFVNEIKLRAYDDQYVDRDEEREILQIAVQLGVGDRAHLRADRGHRAKGTTHHGPRGDRDERQQ